MNLQYIKMESCPHCKCNTVVREEIAVSPYNKELRRHVNGELWEHRKFLCGFTISHIPNFQGAEETSPCTLSQEYVDRMFRKDELQKKIAKLQEQLSALNR